jgi:mitochondrial inner membrane protein COX18
MAHAMRRCFGTPLQGHSVTAQLMSRGLGHETRRFYSLPSTLQSLIHAAESSITTFHEILPLPWYLTIPAYALCVNVAIRLPLSLYARNIRNGQIKLQPFVLSWTHLHGIRHRLDPNFPTKATRALRKETIPRLYKAYGVQKWKAFVPLLGVAPWLLVSEALRRLSGLSGGGLLSLVFGRKDDPSGPPTHDLAEASTSMPGPGEIITTSDIASSELIHHSATVVDHGLTTGGALWVLDLTQPDPTMSLSVVLATVLVAHQVPRTRDAWSRLLDLSSQNHENQRDGKIAVAMPSKFQIRAQRASIMISLFLPFVAYNMPSAMFLYWISSAIFSFLNEWVVNYYMPLVKPQWHETPLTNMEDERIIGPETKQKMEA